MAPKQFLSVAVGGRRFPPPPRNHVAFFASDPPRLGARLRARPWPRRRSPPPLLLVPPPPPPRRPHLRSARPFRCQLYCPRRVLRPLLPLIFRTAAGDSGIIINGPRVPPSRPNTSPPPAHPATAGCRRWSAAAPRHRRRPPPWVLLAAVRARRPATAAPRHRRPPPRPVVVAGRARRPATAGAPRPGCSSPLVARGAPPPPAFPAPAAPCR